MLIHPTIVTYVNDSALENLAIYIFYPHFIRMGWLTRREPHLIQHMKNIYMGLLNKEGCRIESLQ